MSKGKLFVFSGASGVGKSTVLKRVMGAREDLCFSVSATTRAPREGEENGVHYFFVTVPEFKAMIDNGEMLEYDYHNATYYGTPLGQLEEKLAKGNVILDIEPKGAAIVHGKRPEATLIFIMPPSVEELERRLRGRGDTSEEQIAIRMERAKWEMDQQGWYDYVVVNDKLDDCVREILNIIAEKAD